MDFTSHPIVNYYLGQAEALLERGFHLGALLVVVTLSELLIRELAGDSETALGRLLKKLQRSHAISKAEFQIFDEIREIRNLYAHVDLQKFAHSHGIIDADGTATLVNEILQSSEHPEEELVGLYRLMIKKDSVKVFNLAKQAIVTFK